MQSIDARGLRWLWRPRTAAKKQDLSCVLWVLQQGCAVPRELLPKIVVWEPAGSWQKAEMWGRPSAAGRARVWVAAWGVCGSRCWGRAVL